MPRLITCGECRRQREYHARNMCRSCYQGWRVKARKAIDPQYKKEQRLKANAYHKRRYAEDPVYRERVKATNRHYQAVRRASEPDRSMDEVFEALMLPYRAAWSRL